MKSSIRNYLIGVAFAVPVVCACMGFFYWKSEPQQTKRACLDALQKELVAPSATKLIDFRLLVPLSKESPINIKLQEKVDTLSAQDAVALSALDAAAAKSDAISKKILSHDYQAGDGIFDRFDAAQAEANELNSKRSKVWLELRDAKQLLTAYREQNLPEVVLHVDAQNRVGAMLRSEAICMYQINAPRESMKVVQFEQR